MVTSTPFGDSREVYEWISGFVNLERGQSLRSFRLDRMSALAELAGHPEKCAPSIHVAGSKGKGSVTGMTAAILEASGIKTASYTSPHISDFRERLTAGNRFFDEEIYAKAGNELRALVESLPSTPRAQIFDPKNEGGEEPSFFELMTLWFFLCARLSHSGAMAVETGMGGRLDATNILEPLLSVITLIELEHTEYLGNTIAAIAGEKAGIIKPGRPLVLAAQTSEALDVFREDAARKKSPFFYFPDCAEVQNIRVNREGTSFSLVLKNNGLLSDGFSNHRMPELFVPMPGEVHAYNAGLAVLAVKTAFPGIEERAIREGLEGFSLPARFERISSKAPLIIDGAHTKHSVDMCVKTFSALYGNGGILIFGCAVGKDLLSMAELCVPCFSRIIITTPGTFKKSNPEEIYNVFTEQARKNTPQKSDSPPSIFFIPDTAEAIDRALNMALEHGLPVLGTGSFYLAGEIRLHDSRLSTL
jgi:dihydrofolate synthase/folylpolyglutamate synthase